MRKALIVIGVLLIMQFDNSYSQTLQVTLSPDKSKVDRSTKNGTATIFFDSNIEDLSIVCTDENPDEPITKINDNLWFTHIDVKKDIESDGVCYRNYLLKSGASTEYYLTTDMIAPNQVLYYTVALPNELEPKLLEEKAKNIATKVSNLVDEGDSYRARLLALEALPPNLPYTWEAEMALRKATMENSTSLQGHHGRILSTCFSPDNQNLLSCSEDGTAKIWDVSTGRVIKTLAEQSHDISFASYSPSGNYIITTNKDSTIRIWKSQSAKLLKTIHAPARSISASFSPDERQIASADLDLSIRVWNITTSKIVTSCKFKEFLPWNVIYSADGGKIIFSTMGDYSPVVALDAKTGNELFRSEVPKGQHEMILSLACSQDSKKILTASTDSTVRVWDISTGDNLLVLKNKQPQMMLFSAFIMEGRAILGISFNKSITVWNAENGKEVFTTQDEINAPTIQKLYTGASLSPNTGFLALCSSDNVGWLQDALSGPDNQEYQLKAFVNDVTYSPSGDTIAVAIDHQVQVLDAKTGKALYTLDDGKDDFKTVSFSPNGQYLVSGSHLSKTIRIWDTKNKRQYKTFSGNPDWVNSALFSPDGSRIVFTSNSDIYIRDIYTGDIITILKGHQNSVTKAIYSPDGNLIASVSFDNTLRLWDAKTYTCLKILKGHSSNVEDVAFSPDGKYVASASEDGAVILWNCVTGNIANTLRGHVYGVISLAFSPDGRCLISTGKDKKMIVWDVQVGQKLNTWRSYSEPFGSLSFSADGSSILARCSHSVYIWSLPPLQELIDKTRERFKDRPLTQEEKALYNLE